jgi:hypothetical protein
MENSDFGLADAADIFHSDTTADATQKHPAARTTSWILRRFRSNGDLDEPRCSIGSGEFVITGYFFGAAEIALI